MKRFLPKTLTSQTILVLLIGLTVSHLFSMLIYSGDREEALAMLGGRNMAQRIANVAHLVADSPAEWQEKIVKNLNEPNFRVWITPESMLVPQESEGERVETLRSYLKNQMHGPVINRIEIQFLESSEGVEPLADVGLGHWTHMQLMRFMHGIPFHHSLRISMEIGNGQWLNFMSILPESTSMWSMTSLLSLMSMALAVIVLSIWTVRRLTVPLRRFAQAANRLGKDVTAPPLPVSGPLEVQQAVIAFNEMQDNLKHLIENRTHMLAAISHDLRTPITLLKLRIEMMEDGEERTKMLKTLDEMEQMISSTLAFARQDAEQEERRVVELNALVETICDDLIDTGKDVSFLTEEKFIYECKPVAMKRALTNLIENAVKYGQRARVAIISSNGHNIEIAIEDDGPGIPEDKLKTVFEPFYRLESSRSRETGGAGLGLSVAQSIILAHGGSIELKSPLGEGLKVSVCLPK